MYDLQGNVVCEEKACCSQCTPDADTANTLTMIMGLLCCAGKDLMSRFTGQKEDIVGIGLGSIRCCRAC
jgi:hypothetical protein